MQATVRFRKDNSITWVNGSVGHCAERPTKRTGEFLRDKGFSVVNVWDDSVDVAPNRDRHIAASKKRVLTIAKQAGLSVAVEFQVIDGRWGAVLCA